MTYRFLNKARRDRQRYIFAMKVILLLIILAIVFFFATKSTETIEKEEVIIEKTITKEMYKPKVIFADAVSASNTTILVGELAKILKQNGVDIGQNRLFEWLRRKGYLISRQGTDYNMPTQKSMELGLFRVKETSITHSDGHTSVNKTPKITGKGQEYFVNKFLKMV